MIFRTLGRLFRAYRETGDPRYLGRVFDRAAPELLRVAGYLTRDRHRAEDVVQTTFLIAIERAAGYDADRPLLPWLLAILANEARQLHRRESRVALPLERLRSASPTLGDVADTAASAELARCCDHALDGLPELYRPVLILHLRHGLSGQEIAATLARPDATVRSQIARGLELLRRKLPAGIAGAVVFGSATGRGLAAVRAAVFAQVSAPTVAPTAAAAWGSVVSLAVLGELLMQKYVLVGLALLAVTGVGAWTYSQLARGPERPEAAPATAMVAPTTDGAEPVAVTGPGKREMVSAAGFAGAPTEGSLQVTVVVDGAATLLADAACSLWATSEGRGPRLVSDGRTAADGSVGFAGLAPGPYRFVVDAMEHQEDVAIEPGVATRLRCAIAAGYRCGGTVVDRDGRPVAGAEVRRACPWFAIVLARTAADGKFVVDHVSGAMQLWATHGGRQPSQRVAVDVQKDMTDVRLVLGVAGARLSGRVVDERGGAAAGARVYLGFDLCIGSTEIAEFERHDVRSDAAGEFAVDWARPGRVVVAAVPRDNDLERASSREVLLVDGTAAAVQLQFGDGASVTGVVRDDAGKAVVGADVSASSDQRGLEPLGARSVATDATGAFALRGLLAGRPWLSAQRAQGAGLTVVEPVALQTRQQFEWLPVLAEGAPIRLRVVGPEDTPLENHFLSLAIGDRIAHYGATDASGRHRFEHLAPIEHQLRVYGADYGVVLAERLVVPGGDELVIRLDAARVPSARLTGRIVDATGEPVPEAQVALHANSSFVQPQRLDRDGRFQSELLPPGRYGISARAPTRGLGHAFAGVLLVASERHDLGALVLPATAALAVRLRGQGGGGVPEATLRLARVGEIWSGTEHIAADPVDGVHRQAGLDPGDYVLRLHGADVAPQNLPIRLVAGERRELDVVAVRAVPVVFEVRCALEPSRAERMLNVQFDVFDAGGERVVSTRLWPYFDDVEQRRERVRLGFAPGRYRVRAEEAGGKRIDVPIEVPALAPAASFVIDLR